MLLYRYFRNEDNLDNDLGVDVLRNLRLRLSNPRFVNDPFDLIPFHVYKPTFSEFQDRMSSSEYRAALYRSNETFKLLAINSPTLRDLYDQIFSDKFIKHFQSNTEHYRDTISIWARFISFSLTTVEPLNEILMWSHYAREHKGLRITFDMSKFPSLVLREADLLKVVYQNERFGVNALTLTTEHSNTKQEMELIENMLRVKSSAWSYEKEYRWLYDLARQPKSWFSESFDNYSCEFVACPPEAIVRVDIGAKAEKKLLDKINELRIRDDLRHINIYQCKVHATEFRLEYIPI